MEHHSSSCCRHPPSPRLARSRSTTEVNNNAILSPSATLLSRSQRLNNVVRSTSTTKSRDAKTIAKIKPVVQKHKDGLVRFLPRGESSGSLIAGSTSSKPRPNYIKQSGPLSPSAWALSPGRSTTNYFPTPLPPPPAMTEPQRRSSGGGEMSSVWTKYFKKGSSTTKKVQEECRRKFRVVNSTLVQWRFANAKAEAAADARELVAHAKLVNVLLRIWEKRKRVMEKRMEIQRMKVEEKLSRMMSWQLILLTEWQKMERKNVEAVSRVTRKLGAVSVKVPLLDDVKGEVDSIEEALRTATEVMNDIQELLSKFFLQLEKNLYLLTELTSGVEHQSHKLEEMEKIIDVLAHLLVWENNVRVEFLQMVDNSL